MNWSLSVVTQNGIHVCSDPPQRSSLALLWSWTLFKSRLVDGVTSGGLVRELKLLAISFTDLGFIPSTLAGTSRLLLPLLFNGFFVARLDNAPGWCLTGNFDFWVIPPGLANSADLVRCSTTADWYSGFLGSKSWLRYNTNSEYLLLGTKRHGELSGFL